MDKSVANLAPTPSQVVGRLSNAVRLLEEAGLSYDDWQIVIDDPGKRKRLASYWKRGCYEATTSQKRAREIMGANFLWIEEAQEFLKVKYSDRDLKILAEIPYPENTLESVKDTHILVAGYPMSITEIRSRTPDVFHSDNTWWHDKGERFAHREKCRLACLLIRKDEVPDSTGKIYGAQTQLLGPDEEVPRAAEMAYMMALYFLARGEKLFTKVWVRTSSLSSGGSRVYVFFYDGRLSIRRWGGDSAVDRIGLASSRKFPFPIP